jgi:HSP20 family molecular chaperone IbpA
MPENSISDPGKLDVTLKDGVLTVKVPKKPDAIDKADK